MAFYTSILKHLFITNTEYLNLKSASQFHSKIASNFDALYTSSPAFQERFQVWSEVLNQYIPKNSRVLDLGCGSGVFSFYLAQEKNCEVIGIDGAENMIRLCEERREHLGLEQVRFLQAELPLSANTLIEPFDAIISSSVLEYIDDLPAVFHNIDVRLRKGGILVVSFPNRHSMYRRMEKWAYRLLGKPAYYQYVRHVITPQQLDEMLEKYDFRLKHVQYYASSGKFMRMLRALLPEKFATNLFVSVYEK